MHTMIKICISFPMVMAVVFLSSFQVQATGFVEEVACSSKSLTVVLNKSDPDIVNWIRSSKAQPIVYVYGFKARTPCGISLKNKQGTPTFNFTIPYGEDCGVLLTDLEPNYQTAETTVAIEDNNVTNPSKPMRINHVFCLYTRRVQTLRINDISTGHEVVASTGGKPKPKVDMQFRGVDGKPLKAAKFGDTVGLYLALNPDNAYKAIAPKECMFSDKEEMEIPGARTLTFVQSNCPVKEISEIVEPLTDVNEEVYFTKFQTFRFGSKNTVYAHCSVKVCLTQAECESSCFKRVENSSLTAENLRLRFKRGSSRKLNRQPRAAKADPEEVAITNALTILDEEEYYEVSGQSVETCLDPHYIQLFYLITGILAFIVLISLIFVCCLTRKLRLQTRKLESDRLSDCASNDTHSTCGNMYNAPKRRIPVLGLNTDRNYPVSSVGSSVNLSGTVRSDLTDIAGPSSAWIGSFQDHSIPRVHRYM